MKRFDPDQVRESAVAFLKNHAATAWSYFGAEIQEALLDRHVMDELRASHSADSNRVWSATQIVEFRDELERVLAEGVFVGKTKRGLRVSR